MVRSNASSEFGGVRGRVASAPHTTADVAHEQLRLLYATDTSDASDTPEKALLREREMEGRTGEVAS